MPGAGQATRICLNAVCPLVDRQRAVNEIALVDTQTGEVSYGVESLFKVIGNSFPLFKPLFGFAPFVWLMKKVYAFISYNRRVIIPAGHDVQGAYNQALGWATASSTLHLPGWPWVAVLTAYAHHLTPLVPIGDPLREYFICGGQVLFQGVVISLYAPAKRWEYLGNMMTISLAGALLLLPVLLLAEFITLTPIICTLMLSGSSRADVFRAHSPYQTDAPWLAAYH
jgi:hypothetical protein